LSEESKSEDKMRRDGIVRDDEEVSLGKDTLLAKDVRNEGDPAQSGGGLLF
jgi:hypothetical protein